MNSFTKDYIENIRLWLCVAVYGWTLEFQAIILLDHEPLFDRILDCAAVLLTVALWAILAGMVFATLARWVKTLAALHASRKIYHAAIIVLTAFQLARWLRNWEFLETHRAAVPLVLIACCAGLGIWVIVRHRSKKPNFTIHLPSLEECFRFGALPILLGAVFLVSFRVFAQILPTGVTSLEVDTATSNGNPTLRPNVIVIVADALRAKNMSLYGYHRRTTPHIDEFAYHSTVYTQMHSNTTSTQTSLTTLLTGKHPFRHGRLTRYQPPYRSEENLLRLLRDNDYTTAAITSNWDASVGALGLSEFLTKRERQNFELLSLHGLHEYGIPRTRAGERMYLDFTLRSLGRPMVFGSYGAASSTFEIAKTLIPILKEPFFLFIHIFEPHDPFFSPPPFRGMYSSQESETLKVKPAWEMMGSYHPTDQPVITSFKNQYDESIRYLDHEVKNFLGVLAEASNLLLIITSDHGESFEKGYFGHGEELSESSTHIPLIIRWPGQDKGARITAQVQTLDIAPTILAASGIPIPPWMDGQVLSPLTEPKASYTVAVNFKFPHGKRIYTLPTKLAIWRSPYKAIFSCDTNRAELYDLSTDPDETINLSRDKSTLLNDLRHSLQASLETGPARELLACVETISD